MPLSNRRVLITGGTGLIGQALGLELLKSGCELTLLGRATPEEFRKVLTWPCTYFQWNHPEHQPPPTEALQVDAVIHLAGEPINKKRWSESQKDILYRSRVHSTSQLVAALNKFSPATTLITASAIGYYGNGGDKVLTEFSPPGEDFLSQVCISWELESKKFKGRSLQLRLGMVLSSVSGALYEMHKFFTLGLGGKLSKGNQWVSWIHIKDVVNIVLWTLTQMNLQGPLNLVAPLPLRNREFTQVLGKIWQCPTLFTVPSIALKLILGEMSHLLLASQKVVPKKLDELGYTFLFPDLELAVKDLYP